MLDVFTAEFKNLDPYPSKPCFHFKNNRMKNPAYHQVQQKTKPVVALHQLVNQLVIGLLPRTVNKKSFIINDVQREMFVDADENILASVIGSVLNIAIVYTQNNCISISAKLYGDVTLVYVEDKVMRQNSAVFYSLYCIQPLAEKLGGSITISNNKAQGTTVTFIFVNNQQAA